MNLFLESANIDEIKQALDWGVLDGVSINPAHVAKSGKTQHQVVEEICGVVSGLICAETTSMHSDGIVHQARELAAIHPSVIVKVPLTKEGLKAVKLLADEGIRCNVTMTFAPLQALLAAKAGACFVSPYVDRLNRVGDDGFEVVENIKKIFANYRFSTKLLVANIRSPLTVMQAALAGADICAMPFDVLSALYSHPLTEQCIDFFLKDAAKLPPEPRPPIQPLRPKEESRDREIRPRDEMPKPALTPVPTPPPEPVRAGALDLGRTPAPLTITPSKTPPAIIMRRSSGKSGPVPVVKTEGQAVPPTSDPSILTPDADSGSSGSAASS